MVEYKLKIPAGFVEVSVSTSSTSSAPSAAPLNVTFETAGRAQNFGIAPGGKIQVPVLPGKVRIQAICGLLMSEKIDLEVAAGETKAVVLEFGPS